MVKHTKGFKGLSKKVLSAILAASMIMTSSSFVLAAEPTGGMAVVSEAGTGEGKAVDVEDSSLLQKPVSNSAVGGQVIDSDSGTATAGDYTVKFADTQTQYAYTGADIEPEVEVTVTSGGAAVGTDAYQVTYHNNKNVPAADAEQDEKPYAEIQFTDSTESVRLYFTITPVDITDATVKWGNIDSWVYDGTEHHPDVVSVMVGDITLTEDDYEIVVGPEFDIGQAVDETVNAGSYYAWLKAKENSNFTGAYTNSKKQYTIDQADLSTADVTVNVDPIAYNNQLTWETVENAVTVTDNVTGEKVTNFDVEYKNENGEWVASGQDANFADIGSHSIRIVATSGGNFIEGTSLEASYEIVSENSLASFFKDVAVDGFTDGEATYNGKNQLPADFDSAITNVSSLKYGLDYKIVNSEDEEWINVGEYTLEIEGLNKYAGQTASVNVKITPKSITDGMISATQGKHPNSGDPADVVVSLEDSGISVDGSNKKLVEGVDYTYTTELNEDGFGGKVVITGFGNYTTESDEKTTVSKDITTSDKLNLNDPSITVNVLTDFTYDGDTITVKQSDLEVVEKDGSKTYTLDGNDYGFVSGTNVITTAGKATVTIAGKDSYEGERSVEINVNGTSFEDTCRIVDIDDISVDDGKKVSDILNAVKVVYKSTGGTYSSSNYTKELYNAAGEKLENGENLNKGGVYTVRVTPIAGIYTGAIETTFNVIGNDLKTAGAQIADIDDVVYTGEEQKPAVVVTVGDKTLEEGKDYTVAYSDNVKGGEATVTVTGINDYSGTLEKNFTIAKAAQTIEMTVAAQKRDLANGSRAINSKNCILKLATTVPDEDTKFTYTSSNPEVATVSASGVITYHQVGECVVTVSAAATDSCEAASLDIDVVVGKVGAPTFTPSVTSKTAKKAFTVTTSTVKGADGFEVQYSIRSDLWKATTKDFAIANKVTRQTCTTVHSNRTYYIRTRAYQVINGEKVYSDWSPMKTVVTK